MGNDFNIVFFLSINNLLVTAILPKSGYMLQIRQVIFVLLAQTYFQFITTILQARPLLKERKYPDLIDSRILDTHDVLQLFWMVRVAEICLSKDPEKRQSMDKVCLNISLHTRSCRRSNRKKQTQRKSLLSLLGAQSSNNDYSLKEETLRNEL